MFQETSPTNAQRLNKTLNQLPSTRLVWFVQTLVSGALGSSQNIFRKKLHPPRVGVELLILSDYNWNTFAVLWGCIIIRTFYGV